MAKRKAKEEWWVMHCTSCKCVVVSTQRCCGRYLCDKCHLKQCYMAQKQQTIDSLLHLARKLHMALNQVLAGETLSPEQKEDIDENVNVHLGPNYESVIEQK